MLTKREKERIKSICKKISSRPQDLRQNRQYYEDLRKIIHIYEDVVCRCHKNNVKLEGTQFDQLKELAGKAIDEIGGHGEPSMVSLKNYDYMRYGPFLGVSDEGSAAADIRKAAYDSPKMQIISQTDPMNVGVALDAERLAAVGEVAVGPDEYKEIRLECMGRILNSTNVGTRLNLRYYKKRPVIEIQSGSIRKATDEAIKQAATLINPFWKTADNEPRSIVLFAFFKTLRSREDRLKIMKELNHAVKSGKFCNPKCHKLGLLVRVGRGYKGVIKVKDEIDLAKNADLTELAIEGEIRREAEDKISMPGILNYFNPKQASELLHYASQRRIPISPRNLVDPDTVARNVWCGLLTARNMGFELGKYGLFPLTMKENNLVMGMVQSWFSDWTAAPAIYVDFPIVGSSEVYVEENITDGLKKWLKIVAKKEVPIVLIDTADKDKGRKILKPSKTDRKGILRLEQIVEIDKYAKKLGVNILWAGGITLPHSYEFGKLGVFGIYVTSAASISKPVSNVYKSDIMLFHEKEPTYKGVSRVKLLLEAGFLYNSLRNLGRNIEVEAIDISAKKFIKYLERGLTDKRLEYEQEHLHFLLLSAWQVHFQEFS